MECTGDADATTLDGDSAVYVLMQAAQDGWWRPSGTKSSGAKVTEADARQWVRRRLALGGRINLERELRNFVSKHLVYTTNSQAGKALDGSVPSLRFGDARLDAVLSARYGMITELCGEAGAGKTQLLLQLAANNPGETVYVHTEGGAFPVSRLREMVRARSAPQAWSEPGTERSAALDRIYVEHANERVRTLGDMDELVRRRLPQLLRFRPEIRLVIVDSLAAVVRPEYNRAERHQMVRRAQWLFALALQLRQAVRQIPVAVVVANPVTYRYDYVHNTRRPVPALGHAWSHCVNARYWIQRESGAPGVGGAARYAQVMFSAGGPTPGTRVCFDVDASGVHGREVIRPGVLHEDGGSRP
ncbi:hypothetical protein CDCA_CDCA14G3818 [Cyanidium caldarium]|uniref:RecA family profile 1 domain-containing protein n=1 Tax=Cyanidium caldarium TaxID=2771 RepID=A0AAV9IZN1_CYACA|nr:hypothetical protein CDCA_CDCA14G3818 [Cyanidium caldarium]|eukprot:ctg_1194.g265